jgi:hypothetical protein
MATCAVPALLPVARNWPLATSTTDAVLAVMFAETIVPVSDRRQREGSSERESESESEERGRARNGELHGLLRCSVDGGS